MTKKENCNNNLGMFCKRVVITYVIHKIESDYVYLSYNYYDDNNNDVHTYHKLKIRIDKQQKKYILFKGKKIYFTDFVNVQ